MATLTRVQHNHMATTATTAASMTATLGTGVTAGNLLVATITLGTNGLTVTPPAGWTQAGPTESVAGTLDQRIYYLVVGTGGATSFTWSWSGSHSFGWTIEEWSSSSGWPASPVDVTSGGVHASASTAVNCGSPAATAQASELWIGVLSWGDSGETLSGVTAGWTTGDSAIFTANNTSTAFYKNATSTGTPSLAATLSAAVANAGVVATFKPNSGTTHSGTASLAGVGQMTATGTGGLHEGAASMTGVGSLFATGSALVTKSGDSSLAGVGSMSAAGTTPGKMTVTPQTADEVSTSAGVAHSVTSFSPATGETVWVSATWLDSVDQLGKTFTCADSHGNSYLPATGGQGGDGDGGCYLLGFYFNYATAPGATTVTITAAGTGATGAADCLIQPYRVTNAATDQSTAAHNKFAETGTGTTTYLISLTPTVLGSVVFVLGAPNNNNHPVPVPNANTQTDKDWDDDTVGSHGVVGRSATHTTSLTSTTYGWTSTATSIYGYGVMAVELVPAVLVQADGTATLDGVGQMTPTGTNIVPGSASLSGGGVGSMDGLVTAPGTSALSGVGEITATGYTIGALLSGQGDMTASETGTFQGQSSLSGSGSMSGSETGTKVYDTELSGQGSLGVSGVTLGFNVGLEGIGQMVIPEVSGGLVNGVGGAGFPIALPGSSQVAVAPPGSSNWQWIGTLGQVTALKYSFICPGGCDKMSMTVLVPAAYRTQLFNPGWQVKITRGGHQVWYGKLDEPKPGAQGWSLTGVGAGNLGQNFLAYYAQGDTWPTGVPDEILNRAISRGLPWTNPGLGSSPYYSQFWLGQQFDPGSQDVSSFLNTICTRGGLTWYVNSQPGGYYGGNNLAVTPLPTVPNRLLVITTPVARTLGGDINYIIIKYQTGADNATAGTSATYDFVAATNNQSIAMHGQMETYFDLSNAGVMTSAQAVAVGNYVLQIYQRASFAGPFQASYGQLMNNGGVAIDPGTDQAGTMIRPILTDYGYGGEVVPQDPMNFIVGGYEWDDFAQVATITPYQTIDQSLSGLLSMENTVLKPVK